MTEVRKQANRMTFGEIEDEAYQQNLGFSLGQLGKSGTGRIRAAQVMQYIFVNFTMHPFFSALMQFLNNILTYHIL